MEVRMDYTLEAYVFRDLKRLPIKKVLKDPRWVFGLIEKYKQKPDLIKPQDALVLAGLQILYAVAAQSVSTSVKDTSNANNTIVAGTAYTVTAGSGVVTYGIVFGTGNSAVAVTDYVLQAPISHGTGAGNLSYGACSAWESLNSASKCEIVVARTVVNNSGSDITIEECGLYVLAVSQVKYYMWCHDLTGGVVVSNDGAALFLYRQTLT